MKYAEIKEMLDKGFTPEYIMKMDENSDNSDNSSGGDGSGQDPAQDPAKEPENAGGDMAAMIAAALKPVTDSMNEVLKEMQAANIMASRQPGEDKTITAEDALASVIMPPVKK